MPERKQVLYKRIHDSLKNDGLFILGDYTACCNEEEDIFHGVYMERRRRFNIPQERFVHFDIPLTVEHELELIKKAGFAIEQMHDEPDGVTIIVGKR